MTKEEKDILYRHLGECYGIHKLTMPEKFYGYIIRAINEILESRDNRIKELEEQVEIVYNNDLEERLLSDGWISVEDELPQCSAIDFLNGKGETLLVWMKDEGCGIRWICGDPLIWKYSNPNVTHWRPALEPPKEKIKG